MGQVLARGLTPMLCETPPEAARESALHRGPGWHYELKLDGVRILAERREDAVALTYRKGREATLAYPEVVESLRAMPQRRFVLDGEVVALARGKPDFQRLGRRIGLDDAREIARVRREVPVTYVAFDVLAIGERDVRPLPLRARRALLTALVPSGAGAVQTFDVFEEDGRPLFALCQREGLEGVVAKALGSPYRAGARTDEWLKIKCEREDDFVVFGYAHGERGRGPLGALELASYDADGRLWARGKAGSGLSMATIDQLLRLLEPSKISACPAQGPLDAAPRGRVFVRPELVVSVRYLGWSDEGRLRFPVFRGIRADVSPEECRASPPERGPSPPASPPSRSTGQRGPLVVLQARGDAASARAMALLSEIGLKPMRCAHGAGAIVFAPLMDGAGAEVTAQLAELLAALAGDAGVTAGAPAGWAPPVEPVGIAPAVTLEEVLARVERRARG